MKSVQIVAVVLLATICSVALEAAPASVDLSPTPAPDASKAPWRKTLAPTHPGRFPMLAPMKIYYRFGWENVAAAKGSLEFSRPRPGVSKVEVEAHTTGMVRSLWRMDTRALEFCDIHTLCPIRVRQAEWYRSGTSLAAQEFTTWDVLRAKGATKGSPAPDFFADTPIDADRMRFLTNVRARRTKIPDLFDLQSGLLFVRSQPLANGDVIRLTVFQGNAPYLATIRVLGREKLSIAAGTFPAIKLELTLQDITKEFTLATQKRFKRATGWFSDDENRLFLRLETAIFVGSVWAEMERFVVKGKK